MAPKNVVWKISILFFKVRCLLWTLWMKFQKQRVQLHMLPSKNFTSKNHCFFFDHTVCMCFHIEPHWDMVFIFFCILQIGWTGARWAIWHQFPILSLKPGISSWAVHLTLSAPFKLSAELYSITKYHLVA